MEREELLERVGKIFWWHKMDLDGIVTPGRSNTLDKLEKIKLPDSLEGKSVLDVGAWDGFYSFECERRGAERVLAVDSELHSWGAFQTGQAGFLLAHEVYNSKVEYRSMEMHELTVDSVGQFDIVLFLGVIYHVHYPHYILKNLGEITKELMIFETAALTDYEERPAMFIDKKSFKWHPNIKGCYQLLKEAGFSDVEMVTPYPARSKVRASFHARK